MSYEECFGRGQLRKSQNTKEETYAQLNIAESYAKKAEKVLDKELYDISFLTAYISIFHSARALLYHKGYKERSHFCLFEFVRQEFKGRPDIVRMAEIGQNYRETRRMVQYEGSLCSEHAAKEAIRDAKKFVALAKKEI